MTPMAPSSIPMTLEIVKAAPTTVQITVHCDDTITPCIQWSTNLSEGIWTSYEGTNGCLSVTNGYSFITETSQVDQRFFRLIYP